MRAEKVTDPAAPARAEAKAKPEAGPDQARLLALQHQIGNRAVARMLARAPAATAPPKIGPAANIPEDRGDIERGYFSTTDSVKYGVRASGPGREGGLWVDHLFDTQEEAEGYARTLAATGARSIRETSALPVEWPKKADGTPSPGNPVTNVYVVVVPAGTPYISGAIREQKESSEKLGLPSSYGGGGPQTVLAKGPDKITHVAEFPVTDPAPTPASLRREASDTAEGLRRLTAMETKAENDRKAAELELERRKKLNMPWLQLTEAQIAIDDAKAAEKKLAAQRTTLEAQNGKANADLRLLTEPGTSAAQLNELLARRGGGGTTASVTEKSGGAGWQFTEGKGWVKTDTTERSNLTGGVGITDKATTSTVIDPLTGVTTTRTDSTLVVSGSKSSTETTTRSRGVTWAGDDLAYTSGTSTKRESADSATQSSKSSTTGESWKVGLSGVTKTTETAEVVDKTTSSTRTTTGVTRGDGKVGKTTTTVKTDGKIVDGKLTEGTQKTTNTQGGVIAGPDGVGAFGGATASMKDQRANGTYTTGSVGGDCKFVVNVKEVPGDPVVYQLVMTISVGLKGSVGGGGEKESADKDSASGSVSLGLSGAVTATFVHQLSEADKDAYLRSIKAAAGGQADGTHRELGILSAAFTNGPEAAKAAIQSIKATAGSAKGAREMAEGSSLELGVEGKGEVGVTGGAKHSGGTSVGGEFSVSRGGGVKVSVAKKGGKTVLTVTCSAEDGLKAGLTGGYGAASMGYTHEGKEVALTSVSFTLDPADGSYDFDRVYDEIRLTTDAAQLKALAAKYPKLVGARTESSSSGSTGTTKAGVGPVSIGIKTGSERGTRTVTDGAGKKTTTHTGSHTGGAEIAAPFYKASSTSVDKVEATVGPDGRITGDVSETTTESSFAKTMDKLTGKVTKDPIGLATGATKVQESTVAVAGMNLADNDFDALIARAMDDDPRAWEKVIVRWQNQAAWRKVRSRIRAADGDKNAVAAALADFVADDEHGRREMIELSVRRPGSGSGGKRYEWPEVVASHKATFESLVYGDPLSGPRAQAAAGQFDQALAALGGAIHKLAGVSGALIGNAAAFADPTAHAEMVGMLNKRLGELKAEQRVVESKKARGAAAAEADAKSKAEADARDQAERDRVVAEQDYNATSGTLMNNKQQEMRIFGEIDAEYSAKYLGFLPRKADVIVVINKINLIKELHVRWRAQIKVYRELAARYGWQPLLGPDREPNQAKLDEYYARANKWPGS